MPAPEPTPRPRVVGPLLVALMFLAVIGASVGFVLGTRDGGDSPDTSNSADISNDTGAGRHTDEPFTPSPLPSPSSTACPVHTQQQAGKELTQVLYVRTDRSEVWICVDADEALYYQGHSGQPGEELIDGTNAIFLTDVEPTQFGYRARNTSGASVTEYLVSSRELIIQTPNGTRSTEPAADS
ncbi:hypothetical protein [Micromonospora sp. CPCC 206061]|uniref:hypothetical protein n=1 Tax=Micromonospora sp. CPCC 206061 TaxID=3122410 RepID=UPI002FF1C0D8